MSSIERYKEYRQAPLGLILFFGETLRRIVRSLWPLLIAYFLRDKENSSGEIMAWVMVGLAGILLVNSLLSFLFFRYQLTDEELLVRKGYLRRIRLSIPFERIQSIQIKQNIVQQGLQLVTMEVDTAGAGKAEVKFIALKEEVANELKSLLQAQQSSAVADDQAEMNTESVEEEAKTLLKISNADLVKVGVSENHLRSFLVIVSLFFGLYTQVEELLSGRMEEYAQMGIEAASNMSFENYIKIIAILFGISIIISFARAFIRYYELELSELPNAFKLRFGLFNIREYSIPFKKIQLLSWHTNPLRQLFDFQSVKIRQASSNEEDRRTQSMEIPACKQKEEEAIEEIVFGKAEHTYSQWYATHWIFFAQRFFLWSLLGMAIGTLAYSRELPHIEIFIFTELLIVVLCIMAWRKRRFAFGDRLIRIQSGSLPTHEYKMEMYKIQTIRMSQSLIMRWRKRATLTFNTAAGKHLSIPYIPEDLARKVYDYILYKIESAEKDWM